MEERWFDVEGDGGVRLRARRIAGASSDAPALLLHHGLASSQRIWDLMLPGLARRFQVVTFDARGHGISAKPAAGYGFDHVTADAAAVIKAARLRRPIVVGHSWGADVALALAAGHPRAVSGAVLVDGGVFRLRSSFATWEAAKRQLAAPSSPSPSPAGRSWRRFRCWLAPSAQLRSNRFVGEGSLLASKKPPARSQPAR